MLDGIERRPAAECPPPSPNPPPPASRSAFCSARPSLCRWAVTGPTGRSIDHPRPVGEPPCRLPGVHLPLAHRRYDGAAHLAPGRGGGRRSRRRTAIVTRGGSGIGRAVAQRFAENGFATAVLDLEGESAARAPPAGRPRTSAAAAEAGGQEAALPRMPVGAELGGPRPGQEVQPVPERRQRLAVGRGRGGQVQYGGEGRRRGRVEGVGRTDVAGAPGAGDLLEGGEVCRGGGIEGATELPRAFLTRTAAFLRTNHIQSCVSRVGIARMSSSPRQGRAVRHRSPGRVRR
jgi:hypothetical protein